MLRPALAESILKLGKEEPSPPKVTEPKREEKPGGGPPPVPPVAPANIYRRVSIATPVNWRRWCDFYQAVIMPLVEAGVHIEVRLQLEASGEIDANLVDLSVKESVLQFDPEGNVKVEG